MAGHEDLAFLQLRTASDVVASIRGDWLSSERERTLVVKTRDRVIIGDLLLQTVTEHRSGSGPRRLKTLVVDALEAELTAFVMAVRATHQILFRPSKVCEAWRPRSPARARPGCAIVAADK